MKLTQVGGRLSNGKPGGSTKVFLDDSKFEVHKGAVRLKPEYHRDLVMEYVEQRDKLQREVLDLHARIDAMKIPRVPTFWEIARPVVLFTSGVVLTAVLLFVSGNMR